MTQFILYRDDPSAQPQDLEVAGMEVREPDIMSKEGNIWYHLVYLKIHIEILLEIDEEFMSPSFYCACSNCYRMETLDESVCCLSKQNKCESGAINFIILIFVICDTTRILSKLY